MTADPQLPKVVYPGGLTQRQHAIQQAQAWQRAHLDAENVAPEKTQGFTPSAAYQVVTDLLTACLDAEGWPDPADALAPPGRPSWLPIESAPKDGTWILIGAPSAVRGANWVDVPSSALLPNGIHCWSAGWQITGNDRNFQPTHWMPLPAPPGRVEPPQEEELKDGD